MAPLAVEDDYWQVYGNFVSDNVDFTEAELALLRTPVRGAGTIVGGIMVPYVPTVFTEHLRPTYVQEKHVSVVRRGPTSPPTIQMYSYTRTDQQTIR